MLQKQLMLPRGFSRRKLGLSYQQHSQSAGPCPKISSWRWALSERPSIELADIDWQYESALAQSHQLQPLRDIRCNLENQKFSSPERGLHRLTNLQLVLSTGQLPQPSPPPLAQGRTTQKPRVPLQVLPTLPRRCSRKKPELSYQQNSDSAGPCHQLSSSRWALSELL